MHMERSWRLDEDLYTSDNLLDPITFDQLIMAVHSNCRLVNEAAVRRELDKILEMRKQDMMELLEKNMDIIMQKALENRQQET